MPVRVVDVAGVPVTLEACDDERAEGLAAAFTAFRPTDEPSRAAITVDANAGVVPSRPPHSQFREFSFWEEPDGLVLSAPGIVVVVEGKRARAHVPDPAAFAYLEACVYLPVTWFLARHGRFVLHGGAVARDGRALLLLGGSGAGKSTLVAAALEAGWEALADDVVIVHADGAGGFRVHGVHRRPTIPMELGGPVVESAEPLADPRERAALPRDVLATGDRALAGVVLIAHADDDGFLRTAPGFRVLPLLLQSFGATVDPRLRAAFFPVAGDLSRLPRWELALAVDPTVRRAHAAVHLGHCAP
ncbi:MAG TPA: hypothetical protein VEP49_19625 [Acidimicrobiia bacterium]|nr:hypothetical protein [Acidimicrobiia bacterium]